MVEWVKRGLMAALAMGILVGCTQDREMAQSPGKVIKERRALMQNNNKSFKVIKAFAKSGKGSAGAVRDAAVTLTWNAGKIPGLFVKGTSLKDGVGQTRAKPAIWVKWAEFEAAAGKLDKASANLARVAAGGNAGAIKAAAGAIGKACGGCHKQFRGPRKKK
jgi:cytochrome c556